MFLTNKKKGDDGGTGQQADVCLSMPATCFQTFVVPIELHIRCQSTCTCSCLSLTVVLLMDVRCFTVPVVSQDLESRRAFMQLSQDNS